MQSPGPGSDRTIHIKSFEISRTAVTNAQYQACVAAGACTPARDFGPRFNGPEQPVVGVAWLQARDFSRWVGGRLPSDMEWAYAAFSRGKADIVKPSCDVAVIYDKTLGNGCGRNATWPVCSKPKGNTREGLCDMLGNVMEWAEDAVVDANGHSQPPPDDGSPVENSKEHGYRVLRGTAWDDTEFAGLPRSGNNGEDSEYRLDYVGFRPAR